MRRCRWLFNESIAAGIKAATSIVNDADGPEHAAPAPETGILSSTAQLKPRVTKVITEPLNFTKLELLDKSTIVAATVVTNVAVVTWLYPARYLQRMVHSRFQVEVVGVCDVTNEPLGLFSVTCGHSTPINLARSLNGWLFHRPHDVVGLRVLVADQTHWGRSLWSLGVMNNSFGWGTAARRMMDCSSLYTGKVEISAALNVPAAERLSRREANGGVDYKCTCPWFSLEINEEEGAPDVVGQHTPTTPCFTDNESALSALAVPRETLSFGASGTILRQSMHSPVTNLCLGKLISFVPTNDASLLQGVLPGPLPTHDPIAVWLGDHAGETIFLAPETYVETEKDHDGADLATRSLHEVRLGARAIGKRAAFMDKIRGRFYDEQTQTP